MSDNTNLSIKNIKTIDDFRDVVLETVKSIDDVRLEYTNEYINQEIEYRKYIDNKLLMFGELLARRLFNQKDKCQKTATEK